MKVRRRTLCALLCMLLATFGGLWSSPRAFAGSDYGVKLTNQLHLGGAGTPQTCYEDGTNMALEWGQIMQDNSGSTTPYSYQNTWNWQTNNANPQGETAQVDLTDFVTRFRDSVQSGTGWAVSQASEFDAYTTSQPEFESFHKMIRIWAFDPDTTFTLQDGALVASKPIYYTDYFLNPNGGCRWQAWNQREVEQTLISFARNELLFVNAQSITYPADYTGQPIPASFTPPAPTYVAMGDSFSSGEGNPPFEVGSDTSSDTCHRSPQAYPRLLQNDSSLDLGPTAFVACSGALTSNVLNGQNGEPAQVDAITADTKVVTITVGGDDIGFAGYAAGCYAGPCGPGTPSYSGIMAAAGSQALVTRLESTYEAILAKATSPDAQIYVVDYPYIAPDGAGMCAGFDVSGAHSIESMLNLAIEQSVAEVGDSKLHYVSTNAPGSPFDGRSLCSSSDSDFNGLKYPFVYSLYPNAQGQHDYATVVKDYIQSH